MTKSESLLWNIVGINQGDAHMTIGTKNIAQRIVNAENHMIETLSTIADISQVDAAKAFNAFRKFKAIKLDAVNGRYLVKHGAFMEPAVILRAVEA